VKEDLISSYFFNLHMGLKKHHCVIDKVVSKNVRLLRQITYPFKEIGVPHIAPALPFEEALKMMEKM
jgi:hypothetical protein